MNRTPQSVRCLGIAILAGAALSFSACSKGLGGGYSKCITINTTSSKYVTYSFPDGGGFTLYSQGYNSSNCTGTATLLDDAKGTFAEGTAEVAQGTAIDFVYQTGLLANTTVYQIYDLDGSRLYLGDASGVSDGASAAKRPTALEGVPYVKQ